jgi:hypothetical protein
VAGTESDAGAGVPCIDHEGLIGTQEAHEEIAISLRQVHRRNRAFVGRRSEFSMFSARHAACSRDDDVESGAVPAWWDRGEMPTVEERLAYLEGRAGDQTTAIADVRADIRGLRDEVNGLRTEMTGLRTEVNGGFGTLRSEFNRDIASLRGDMDRRFSGIDARFVAADAKVTWLIGIQVGMLLMIASAALGYFFK